MVRFWSVSMVLTAVWFVCATAAFSQQEGSPKPVVQDGETEEVAEASGAADEHDGKANEEKDSPEEKPARATVTPKPLSPSVTKGLEWLIEHQHANGGWGQGEESSRMRGSEPAPDGAKPRDLPNVADTAMATLALIRSGSSPSDGPYSTAINRAVEFMYESIEAADEESLWITNVRGTRVQNKIGPHIDTFLAALVLAEVKDTMPTPAATHRVSAALEKTLKKIERHQDADGQWAGAAWAGGLSNAFAVKAINRISQSGVEVDEEVRRRAMALAQNLSQSGAGGGRFADDGRSAGIELYAAARAVGELNDAVHTNAVMRGQVEAKQASAEQRVDELKESLAKTNGGEEAAEIKIRIEEAKKQRDEAAEVLQLFAQADADLEGARGALARRMNDERFVAGFGTNGGEEFISYLNIGETLVVEGGEAWEAFDKRMTENLTRVQNDDGSWTGHHCITGRTFCTASALLVLMVDRSPNPIAATLGRK